MLLTREAVKVDQGSFTEKSKKGGMGGTKKKLTLYDLSAWKTIF